MGTFHYKECVHIIDLKKGLDRATYRFKIQVFEDMGAILVGPNLVFIGGI